MSEDHEVLVYFDIKAIDVVIKDAEDLTYAQFPSSKQQLATLPKLEIGRQDRRRSHAGRCRCRQEAVPFLHQGTHTEPRLLAESCAIGTLTQLKPDGGDPRDLSSPDQTNKVYRFASTVKVVRSSPVFPFEGS